MEAERGELLRINAPEWYRRADFMAWLNDSKNTIATWHHKGNTSADEYSDVFVTIDGDEGSNSDMPADIWQAIVAAAKAQGIDEGLVWISNVG